MPIPVLRRLLCAGVLLLPAAASWGEPGLSVTGPPVP